MCGWVLTLGGIGQRPAVPAFRRVPSRRSSAPVPARRRPDTVLLRRTFLTPDTTVGVSDAIDSSRSGDGTDITEESWIARNLWVLEGVVTAAILVGLGFASLATFEGALGNVLWAIPVTLAMLVLLIQTLFAGVRIAQTT